MSENDSEVALTPTQKRKMAAQKRLQTMATKKRVDQIVDQYKGITNVIPDTWARTETDKLALLKSIHSDILGKDKEGNGRTLDDLKYFMFQCSQRNLNPFKQQIHAVYIYDKQVRGEKLVVITGIGGFRSIAQRSPRPLYAGSGEPVWDMDEETGLPKSATVQVFAYNPVTGEREAITTGVAWFDEYKKESDEYVDETDADGKKIWDAQARRYKSKKSGEKVLNPTWQQRPKGMIAKCAEALALRAAFPEELSGLYVQEEVDHLTRNADDVIDIPSDDSLEDNIDEALNNYHKGDTATE